MAVATKTQTRVIPQGGMKMKLGLWVPKSDEVKIGSTVYSPMIPPCGLKVKSVSETGQTRMRRPDGKRRNIEEKLVEVDV